MLIVRVLIMVCIETIKGRFLLAISGWVDSLVLLDFFVKNYNKKDLVIAHFNHNIRWSESDWDELFVWELAKKYWIKFYSEKVLKSPKSEEEARDLRYDFLFKIWEKEICDYVVTAQHKDDQIETLMLQLIRWTWSFSPMKEFKNIKIWKAEKVKKCVSFCGLNIYRPFLQYSKQELLSYANQNNLEWREDSTNKQDIYTRNIIRNTILPKILEINPNFWESLIRFSTISWDNWYLVEKLANELLNWNNSIAKVIFDKLHISIKRMVIKQILLHQRRDAMQSVFTLNFTNIEEILEMISKWIWWKEKHWFRLENWIIYYASTFVPQPLWLSKLILASASPQRKRLLSNITNDFIVIPSKYEEKWDNKKTIEENAIMFAEKKALDIARKHEWSIIIWCDTFVVHPKYWVYMKPRDINEAKKQLKSYSWESVKVISWLSVIEFIEMFCKNISEWWQIKKKSKLVETIIKFDKITSEEVDIWLSKNEWQWRSWSCSVEWYASKFIKEIKWCFFNIVWLPVYELDKILKEFI